MRKLWDKNANNKETKLKMCLLEMVVTRYELQLSLGKRAAALCI